MYVLGKASGIAGGTITPSLKTISNIPLVSFLVTWDILLYQLLFLFSPQNRGKEERDEKKKRTDR